MRTRLHRLDGRWRWQRHSDNLFCNPNGTAPGDVDTVPNGQMALFWGGANGESFPLLSRGMVEIL